MKKVDEVVFCRKSPYLRSVTSILKVLIVVCSGLVLFWLVNSWIGFGSENRESEFEVNMSAAEKGDAKAPFNLGLMYKKGSGVMKNDEKAIEWFRKAAERGWRKQKQNSEDDGRSRTKDG